MSKYKYLFLYFLNYCHQSFEDILLWYKELNENANPDIKLILVGNKCDLNEEREIKNEDVEKLTNELDIELKIETSAKSGENVDILFVEASKILYKQYSILENKRKESNKKLTIEKTNNKDTENKKEACHC